MEQNISSQSFNISTAKETSVNELYTIIKKVVGFEKEPFYANSREGEVLRSCLDNTRAKTILNWNPKYSIEEGIELTIAWLKSLS